MANTELGRAFAITPHNTNDLSKKTRGIFVGVAGDLKIDTSNGQTVTLKNLAAGVIHPISAKRVYLTGTAATDIVGFY